MTDQVEKAVKQYLAFVPIWAEGCYDRCIERSDVVRKEVETALTETALAEAARASGSKNVSKRVIVPLVSPGFERTLTVTCKAHTKGALDVEKCTCVIYKRRTKDSKDLDSEYVHEFYEARKTNYDGEVDESGFDTIKVRKRLPLPEFMRKDPGERDPPFTKSLVKYTPASQPGKDDVVTFRLPVVKCKFWLGHHTRAM